MFRKAYVLAEMPPFYFLDNLIKLLCVDDNPDLLKMLKDMLAPIRLYDMSFAAGARRADEILEMPDCRHLCLFDLGLDDMQGDQFYLLRKYHKKSNFIILTGAQSATTGFCAHELGAVDLFEKSAQFDYLYFAKSLNRHAMYKILNPTFNKRNLDSLTVATKTLFEKSPSSVTQWAMEIGITDRELRHIWKKNLGANAKIILFIYQLFKNACAHYEKLLEAKLRDLESEEDVQILKKDGYKKQEEYFHMHKSTITDYIEFGNLAAFM
ncbi:MAG: response regulator [Chitinivibrionales bacterium]|nr:response regulator [Chitinivibrionales bacterium]